MTALAEELTKLYFSAILGHILGHILKEKCEDVCQIQTSTLTYLHFSHAIKA